MRNADLTSFLQGPYTCNKLKFCFQKPCPEESASFLSKKFYSWFDSFAIKGYRNPLEAKDLWDLNEDDSSRYIVPIFEYHLQKTLAKTKRYAYSDDLFQFISTLFFCVGNKNICIDRKETKNTLITIAFPILGARWEKLHSYLLFVNLLVWHSCVAQCSNLYKIF